MSGPLRAALVAVAVTAVLLTVALTAVTTWSTRPSGDAALQQARSMVAVDAAGPVLQAAVLDCRAAPTAYGVEPDAGGAGAEAACTAAVSPSPEWYLGRPTLSAGSVAERDVLLLGLGLTALAGTAGLLAGRRRTPSGTSTVALGGVAGLVATGALWVTVGIVLAGRDLPPPGLGAVLQTGRVGALTAVAAGAGHLLSHRLGGVVPGLVAAVVLSGLSLLTPASVLDLAGALVLGRW